jgi:hypothetical protein
MMASRCCGGGKSRAAAKEQRRAAKLRNEKKMDGASSRGCNRDKTSARGGDATHG